MRTFVLLSVALWLLTVSGCTTGEGERCNPLRFTDECGAGSSCTYPINCAIPYCCPPADKVGPQTSANCQACSLPDGGTTD